MGRGLRPPLSFCMKPVIFSACDEGYGRGFGPVLKASAEANGFECVIVTSGEFAKDHAGRVRACLFRYRILPDILRSHECVLMLDTDCIVRKSFDIEDGIDLGLITRPEKSKAFYQVNGSAVYLSRRALPAAEWLKEKLSGPGEWYDDQLALRELMLKHEYRFRALDDLISWKMADVPIWTGKGARKLSDEWFTESVRWYPNALRAQDGSKVANV